MAAKTKLLRYAYECDCGHCLNVGRVHDPQKRRDGIYCLPAIRACDAGKKWTGLHADDDRHIRCDCYSPNFPADAEQLSFEEVI